jgi:hypothetical protein
MVWALEVDHMAYTGKYYSVKFLLTFAEAKAESERISKQDGIYLVSLYKVPNRIIGTNGIMTTRAYIQRHGGKLINAGSKHYKVHESPVTMPVEAFADYPIYRI